MEAVAETSSALVTPLEEFLGERYRRDIERLCTNHPQQKSLVVSYEDLDRHSPELAEALLKNPDNFIASANKALESLASLSLDDAKLDLQVRIANMPSEYTYMIRNLTSDLVDKFIAMDGIVTKITDILPRVKIAVFECRRCGRVYRMLQTDKNRLVTPGPCACETINFDLKEDESKFVDVQKAEIQEPLEMLKGGEQAKHVVMWISDDLVSVFIS